MTPFMNQDFLLKSETAKVLYHQFAEKMPIIDYHCHINPMEIYEDKRYNSITEVWLDGDHYKWRAMRSCGVPEYDITGEASPAEKFQKWGETIPNLIGNPLYHWTHLELQRYFGITEPLTGDNAMEIYEKCNAILAQRDMSVRGIIRKSGVKLICTTDDPVDDLRAHELLAADPTAPAVVLPAFRPDKAMRADKATFPAYVAQLEAVVGYPIHTVEDMRRALLDRIAYFADHGCTVSDHALDYCFCEEATEEQLNDIFARAKSGKGISWNEQLAYHTALLITVGKEYAENVWVPAGTVTVLPSGRRISAVTFAGTVTSRITCFPSYRHLLSMVPTGESHFASAYPKALEGLGAMVSLPSRRRIPHTPPISQPEMAP